MHNGMKTLHTQSLFLADLARQQREAGFVTDAIFTRPGSVAPKILFNLIDHTCFEAQKRAVSCSCQTANTSYISRP